MTKENKYYVYGAYVDGVLKYVGKGTGNRYKHCMSGKSSCVELNRDFFSDKEILVKFIAENLCEKEAFNIEADSIEKHSSTLYNKSRGVVNTVSDFNIDYDLLMNTTFVTDNGTFELSLIEVVLYSRMFNQYTLYAKSGIDYSESQLDLSKIIKASIKTVQRSLLRFKDMGLVETYTNGKDNYYVVKNWRSVGIMENIKKSKHKNKISSGSFTKDNFPKSLKNTRTESN